MTVERRRVHFVPELPTRVREARFTFDAVLRATYVEYKGAAGRADQSIGTELLFEGRFGDKELYQVPQVRRCEAGIEAKSESLLYRGWPSSLCCSRQRHALRLSIASPAQGSVLCTVVLYSVYYTRCTVYVPRYAA